ncbi:MAG: hypothetical protein IKJ01_09715 [Lachnospiraceae bacterium]|nr:hypothetical protein [Lachnospiraceae bacterium]
MKKRITFKNILLSILGICMILFFVYLFMEQFIWKTSSYITLQSPIGLFFFCAILYGLPIHFLEKRYKDTNLEPSHYNVTLSSASDVGKWILSGIAKIFLIIVFIIIIFAIPSLTEKYILPLIINTKETFLFSSDFYLLYMSSALSLAMLLSWLYSKRGIFPDVKHDFFAEGEKAQLPNNIKHNTTIIAIIVFLLLSILPLFYYQHITEQGVTQVHFGLEKTYIWNDVKSYKLQSKFDGTLDMIIEMHDGNKISLMNTILYFSNFPKDTYPNDEQDFWIYLAQTFKDKNIPFDTNHWDKLYHSLKYDYWKELALAIKEVGE